MRQSKGGSSRHAPVTLLGGVAALLIAAGGWLCFLGGTHPGTGRAIGGPFALTDTQGRTVTEASFRGRWMLLYFGYTQCRDVCPTTLAALGPALAALGTRGALVQPVFITVDPAHDTPAAVGEYIANFTPRLVGLTGSAQALARVREAYRVRTIAHPDEIAHSSALLLVAPDGRFVAPIAAGQSADALAAAIAAHMT